MTDDSIDELAEELGIDTADIPSSEGVTDDIQPSVENKRITKFVPVEPRSPEIGDHETKKIEDGQQIVLVEKKRPKCPTCGYLPSSEDDPLHLPECYKCSSVICPECGSNCDSCNRWMCHNHTSGHGYEQLSLCAEHRKDVQDRVEFEREKELEEMRHKHRMKEKEMELKKQGQLEEQKRKLVKLQSDIQEKAERLNIQKEKLKLAVWNQLVNNQFDDGGGQDRLGNSASITSAGNTMRERQEEAVGQILDVQGGESKEGGER